MPRPISRTASHGLHFAGCNTATPGPWHPEPLDLVLMYFCICRYRNMGVSLLEGPGDAQAKRAVKQAQKQLKKMDRIHLRTQMRDNVNRDLPRNVPY